ncbi:MAG TPA: ABC transporter permease, partial [Thermoanaerobaculia bacterium]|nr:ABC transporter permease [Thermoanaerobaculia bacterium]
MKRFQQIALPLMTVVIILALWSLAVKFSGTKIFPSPIAVAKAITTLGEKSLLLHYIGDSLTRVFAGYL